MRSVDPNYDLYIPGTPVPLRQSAKDVTARVSHGTTSNLSLGAVVSYAESMIEPGIGTVLPPSLAPLLDLAILRPGAVGGRDTRDGNHYPTSVTLASAEPSFGIVSGGVVRNRDRRYAKSVAKMARYSPVFREAVFAWQAVACAASDEAPFCEACSLGGGRTVFAVTHQRNS